MAIALGAALLSASITLQSLRINRLQETTKSLAQLCAVLAENQATTSSNQAQIVSLSQTQAANMQVLAQSIVNILRQMHAGKGDQL